MSAPPKTKLWPAEEHTVAKIEIVRRYCYRWAIILGQRFHGKPLTYIDGFAGPGEYTNHPEGSPTAALESVLEARANAKPWVAGDIRAMFIEKDAARCAHLNSKCEETDRPSGVSVSCVASDFVDGIEHAKKGYGKAFASSAPLLVFVDPFGATGAPFATIKEILASRTSEVIINFDADGVARIWSGGSACRAEELLTEIYGGESWRDVPWEKLDHRGRCVEAARLYKKCLLAVPRVDYAFAFEMGESSKRLDYFLIFASQNEKGLEIMKEVMKGIDQTGDFKFYDANVGQHALLRFDQPELWIDPMCEAFSGTTVAFSTVKKWVLNETPFFTFKTTMLKPAAERGLLEAVPRDGAKVAKGQFPEDKLEGIRFKAVSHA